jgi:hypothetical protein
MCYIKYDHLLHEKVTFLQILTTFPYFDIVVVWISMLQEPMYFFGPQPMVLHRRDGTFKRWGLKRGGLVHGTPPLPVSLFAFWPP